MPTGYGSAIYEGHRPVADAACVALARAAGAIVVGKTNTPEFGAGANTRNAVYGATGNPFDPMKSCAGSSGGSAAVGRAGTIGNSRRGWPRARGWRTGPRCAP